CGDLRNVMAKVVEMKAEGKDKSEISELRVQGSFHFLALKQLNRSAQINCKQVKDKTLETKQKLDNYNLQLENLQYEISHLRKEITKCLEFRSRHDDIQLVPVEDFYEEAPDSIAKSSSTKSDEHKQTLARLDWELEQRKLLADELTKLKQVKSEVLEEIGTKKQHLQVLAPALQNLLKSTLPLQDALNLPINKTRKLHETAQLLPRPLFVLFLQAKAYQEACDPNMGVDIEGDVTAAEKVREGRRMVVEQHGVEESDSDEEQEDPDSSRSRRGRKQREMETDLPSTGLYSPHPLVVGITLNKNSGADLEMKFSFLPKLNFVVVKSIVTGKSEVVKSDLFQNFSSVLQNENLLQCLGNSHKNGGDWGTTCPNPASLFLLQNEDLGEVFGNIGRPYLWAQELCGLEFLHSNSTVIFFLSILLSANMRKTMKKLRSRVSSRVKLAEQMTKFTEHIIPSEPTTSSLVPNKVIQSSLATWTSTSSKSFSKLGFTTSVLELLGDNFDYYVTTVKRGSVGLIAAVAISPDHPVTHPIFKLSLDWMGRRTADNDDNIREMESELNITWPKLVKNPDNILPAQLLRLTAMLDIYIETECMNDMNQPVEFPSQYFCSRKTKGPARIKPFHFDPVNKVYHH
uniref:THO complex subunit 5 homolog n=1 Tax=Ciona savignyi TaxID=51511 RepID=H2ZCI5_CIOSA